MDKVYDKCCGIDLHKKLIVACFKQGNRQEIRDFGATTRELLEMADWLKEGGCEMVEYSTHLVRSFRTFSAGHPEIQCNNSGCQCSPL